MTQAEFNTALDAVASAAHSQFTWTDKLDQVDYGILFARNAINDLYNLVEYAGPGENPL